MGKLTTHSFNYKASDGTSHRYSLGINVTKDGLFTCTLPEDAAEMLKSLGVVLEYNRAKNPGYYQSKTMEGLLKSIVADFEEAFSRELVEDIAVLQYWINTRCCYGLLPDGEIVPNIGSDWAEREEGHWRSGTQTMHAGATDAFGLDVAVAIKNKRVYRYRSGTEKVEYQYHSRMSQHLKDLYKDDYYYRFITGLNTMSFPSSKYGIPGVKEMPYDRDMAKLIVDMIKAVIVLNEKIEPIISDDSELMRVARVVGRLM